jgi:hypothetical protein
MATPSLFPVQQATFGMGSLQQHHAVQGSTEWYQVCELQFYFTQLISSLI